MDSGLALLVTASVVFSLGAAPVFVLATDLIVGIAPPERAGAAAAISETGSELGGALGIAILGSIGAAIYRGRLADSVPAGVPPDQADAARETLGGAAAVAEQLPPPLSSELLDAARDAFTDGIQTAALTSAAMAAGTAVLVVVLLRRPAPTPFRRITPSSPRADRGPRTAVESTTGARSSTAREVTDLRTVETRIKSNGWAVDSMLAEVRQIDSRRAERIVSRRLTHLVHLRANPTSEPARAAEGQERSRLWARWRDIDEQLDGYAAVRTSETAVVILEPRSVRSR
jgi:hypothetical protein